MVRFQQHLASGNIEAALAEWSGSTAGGARGPRPHTDGGRAGGAVVGRGGDRPRAPAPDRPSLDHRPADRADREPSLPEEPVVAVDDRVVPGRSAGRRARGVPQGTSSARRAARRRTRSTAARAGVPHSRPGRAAARRRDVRGPDVSSSHRDGDVRLLRGGRLGALVGDAPRRRWRPQWPSSMCSCGLRWTVTAGTSSLPAGETFGAAFHRADDAAAWARELQLEVSDRTVARRCRAGSADRDPHRRDRGTGGQLFRRGRQHRSPHRRRRAWPSDPGVGGDRWTARPKRCARSRDATGSTGRLSAVRILQLDEGRHPRSAHGGPASGQPPAPTRSAPRPGGRARHASARLSRSRPSSLWSGPEASARPGSRSAAGHVRHRRAGGVWLVELAQHRLIRATYPVPWPTSWTSRRAPAAA